MTTKTKTRTKSTVLGALAHPPKVDLVGLTEISERTGQKRTTVHNWTVRRADFPAPYAELSCGKVWDWAEVNAWLVDT